MFSDRSRYKSVPVAQVKLEDGRNVSYVRVPARARPALLGYHKRLGEQRLDHRRGHHRRPRRRSGECRARALEDRE